MNEKPNLKPEGKRNGAYAATAVPPILAMVDAAARDSAKIGIPSSSIWSSSFFGQISFHNGIFTSANVELTHNKKNQMQYNAVGNVFNWNGIMQLAIY